MSHYDFFQNKECEYFPCHAGADPESFSCLFCYCPLYHQKNCPGNPKFLEKEGRTLKVCTNCTYPHQPENYDKIVQILKSR